MQISEVFYSVQGEGVYAGAPTAFVRFQGCPFRCTWCDSAYTWEFERGEHLALDEVLSRLGQFPTRRVCITGGEPLAHPRDFLALAQALDERGYWIEVETSGGYRLLLDAPVDSWVMDIKCPASQMERYNKYDELARLRPQDQLKFVVADRADFDFALGVLAQYRPRSHVLFSPVWGRLDPAALAEWVKAEAPQARLSIQVHKVLWGDKRGV
jgi:7-carboxy-7-deazaguanine synthase